MKNTLIAAALMGFAATAAAQGSCQKIGGNTFCSGSPGVAASTTWESGNQRITTFSNGATESSQTYGGQTFTKFSDGRTARTVDINDNQRMTQYSDGRTSTTTYSGSLATRNYSDGRRVSCIEIIPGYQRCETR
jgi:hypothetical protein